MFRPVKVFDVSQTDGKPLPELASSLSGTVPHYEAFLEAVWRSAPVPIEFEPMTENMDGYFSSDQQRIALREGMSEVLLLTLAIWICVGLVYVSGLVLGLLSTVIALLGVAVLVTYSPQNGLILLVIAFLISPFGLPKLAFWLLGKVQDLKYAIQDLVYG